jgi:peptidyl-dipeptidase A
LADLTIERERALWVADTYITSDTEFLAAKADERLLAYLSQAASDASAYRGATMSRDTARELLLLKQSVDAPAPKDPAKRAEFARLSAKLSAEYGSGKNCEPAVVDAAAPASAPHKCQNIDDLSEVLATSRNFDELTEAWRRWHTISAPMRGDYAKFVELANEGAREFGYRDLGALWRSSYDMSPDEFAAESARLWSEVQPLYQDLHCYAPSLSSSTPPPAMKR